jgi:hypothetical protein
VVVKASDSLVPKGYESCTLSIEGKGIVIAYQLKDENAQTSSDFYLIYCLNNKGEMGWYQYDRSEGTYQRCSGIILAGGTQNPGNSEEPGNSQGGSSVSGEIQQRYEEMKEELQQTKKILFITWCAAALIILILVIIIIVILVRHQQDKEMYVNDDDIRFIDM